ncbi:hypothetical protein HMPREF9306_00601 [Propionimicrobium lymphophilum ACS-093-V-SCH5]|uniref:Uncharacterized protein n=1 Tax=Propionimicrobium lymphophilum ACS-093-V-SCH5 TaxID=883161 RepID=S2WK61_9ACTN|nr:hypothetical protein HMPREF9306_00601 [Propionimicrobium lymphophilum ACS-093-V-SCH5]
MWTPARPRLPDGDCVFISDGRIVARADAPFIAADMTWLGLTLPDAPLRILPSRFRNYKIIQVSKPRRS